MAYQTPLEIQQGSTWSQLVTWLDLDGVPIPVTDYTAKMQLRSGYNDCYAFLTLSTEASSILVNGASGQFTLTAEASTTASLMAETYVYDMDVISPTGEVTRLLEGTVTVTPRVTRL